MELRRRLPLLAAAVVLALAACAACAQRAVAASGAVESPARLERWGFTAFWDPRSAASLTSHASALDVAVTSWIALDSVTGAPSVLHAAARGSGDPARTMALVTSWVRSCREIRAMRRR